MYKNYFFDLYGTLVDIRTDEQEPSLWRDLAEFISLFRSFLQFLFLVPDRSEHYPAEHQQRDP